MLDLIVRELRHAALAAGLFVALVSSGVVGAQGAGSISGTVTTSAGALPPLRVTFDQRVCGTELPDEALVVDGQGRVANAVVTLAGVKARGHASAAGIGNDRCRFSPRVQIVQPHAVMTTTSSDPILHTTNAQVAGGRSLFNVALPVPGIKISKPVSGPGVVRLSCNTHPWMNGWIVVTDEMAAMTGSDGRFVLKDVPAGTYELRVWHETLKAASQKVTVAAGGTATVAFVLR